MSIIPAPPQRRKPDFTLTMINIVFLLLLFFLTTGSLTNREEAQSAIPVTRDLPLEKLPRPLLLIQRDGSLLLDGAKVERNNLVEAARGAIAERQSEGTALNLLAQRDMPASDLLGIAAILRAEKLPIKIVTLRDGEPKGPAP